MKAGLVDEGHVLIPSKGVPFCYPLYPQSQCGRGLPFEHCGTPMPESFNVTLRSVLQNRRFPSVYPGKRRFQSVGLNVTFIVSPGLGKLRQKDEGVKAGLVDDGCHLLTASCIYEALF